MSTITSLRIGSLEEQHLDAADHIFRTAFGTFMGMPDPTTFAAGMDYVKGRWRADPTRWVGAFEGDRLVGSNCITVWGRFGFFGPLTVLPEHWDGGVARLLLDASEQMFEKRQVTHRGLFTFPNSPKHLFLYQKYGYWARRLTPLLIRPLSNEAAPRYHLHSQDSQLARAECSALCQEAWNGLDLISEIEAVTKLNLGDTVVLPGVGFAVCHCGGGTEAGPDTCYIKFGFSRPGHLGALVGAVEEMARERGLKRVAAGVNMECSKAYRHLLGMGFRALMVGVAMLHPDEPAFLGKNAWILGDWR